MRRSSLAYSGGKSIRSKKTVQTTRYYTHWQLNHVPDLRIDINKTQGRAMSMADLPNMQLHNDNLRQFNQAREEMLLSLDRNVDEEFLAHLYERQLRRSMLMKNALTFHHSDIILMKEPKWYKRLRAITTQIFEKHRQKSIHLSEGAVSR